MKQLYLDYKLFDGTEEEFLAVENFMAKEWKLNGKFHRENGPSLIFFGFESWHQNGQLHRLGGPAVVNPDGSKRWYKNGVLHRLCGPAVECLDKFAKINYANGVGFIYDQWWVDGVKICDITYFPVHLFDMR